MVLLQFVRQKIKNKGWLNLCLLAGFSLLVAVFTCHPMFETGSENQILQTAFTEQAAVENRFPAVIEREKSYKTEEYDSAQDVFARMEEMENEWLEYIDVDAVSLYTGSGIFRQYCRLESPFRQELFVDRLYPGYGGTHTADRWKLSFGL